MTWMILYFKRAQPHENDSGHFWEPWFCPHNYRQTKLVISDLPVSMWQTHTHTNAQYARMNHKNTYRQTHIHTQLWGKKLPQGILARWIFCRVGLLITCNGSWFMASSFWHCWAMWLLYEMIALWSFFRCLGAEICAKLYFNLYNALGV